MGMRFINMSTDHKGMVAFGESLCKFYSQPVGFFRRDLTGEEGLAHMIGDYIISAAHPSGSGNVLTFCQQELGISGSAVTSKAGDKSAIVRLLWIGRIVDNIADRLAFRAAFADMQRHDTSGCLEEASFPKRNGLPAQTVFNHSIPSSIYLAVIAVFSHCSLPFF